MDRSIRRVGEVPSQRDVAAATFLGIVVALSLSTLLLVAQQVHASPLPMPLAVAFVVRLVGKGAIAPTVLLPVGLALHVAYVTAATVAWVVVFRRRLGPLSAFAAAVVLWLLAGLVFLPFVGWGLFGLGLGASAALFAAGVHLVFWVLLWAAGWVGFGAPASVARVR